MKDNDIWSGYRLGESQENTPNINYMIAMQKRNEESSFLTIVKIAFCIIATIAMLAITMVGPRLSHNALVVCSGSSCTTYTEWIVINENGENGVLEVWAGGRLQRFSNGTWHYE